MIQVAMTANSAKYNAVSKRGLERVRALSSSSSFITHPTDCKKTNLLLHAKTYSSSSNFRPYLYPINENMRIFVRYGLTITILF